MSDRTECEKERADLATMDDDRRFRDLFGEANRANVSFYPIDPRGLPTFDTPIGPEPPLPLAPTQAQLTHGVKALMTLALNTDGIALVNNNDLHKQLRRVADDLTSYYLMGYYSTNGRPMGSSAPSRCARSVRGSRSGRAGLPRRDRGGSREGACGGHGAVPEAKAAMTARSGRSRATRARRVARRARRRRADGLPSRARDR